MTQFSIFLPVRNGWPYVVECVENILGQTYPHFELNVLDNQSTDETLSWLKSLNDSRVHIFTSSKPLSIVDSWRRIKDVKKHEFMTMIGHDDILKPDFLVRIKRLIDTYPDAALYQTNGIFINAKGKTIRAMRHIPLTENETEYLYARLKFQSDISGTGYVMRSNDYDRVGGIPSFENLFFADDALWLSLIRKSYKVCDPAQCYAIRTHSASTSGSVSAKWMSIVQGLTQFSKFLHDNQYIHHNSSVSAEFLELEFMLTNCRNAYIFAIIEASAHGNKIDPVVLFSITSFLSSKSPTIAARLRRSTKVIALERLNASPLRWLIQFLWRFYNRCKYRVW